MSRLIPVTCSVLALGAFAAIKWFSGRSRAHALTGFKITRVLKATDNDVALLGTFEDDLDCQPAVVVLMKTALDASDLPTIMSSLSLKQFHHNNIYYAYQAGVTSSYHTFKVTLIYPATDAHIKKHSSQTYHMVCETKELYAQVTQPYIESIPSTKIEWVYNILDHKKESETIIFENCHPVDGFMLLPDFKWSNQEHVDSIYCLAIVHDRSIRSLRDLRACHLPLLKNIREQSLDAIQKKFGVQRSKLRVFVHYQPTYYHFHVHFCHVSNLGGVQTGKAVLLEDIITNLTYTSEYYKNATLSYVMGTSQHEELYKRFNDIGVIQGTTTTEE